MRLAATPSRLFALAVAGQFLFGIVLALPGALFGLPAWTEALGFDVAAQARLLMVFFAGQLVWTAVAGGLVDRSGAQRVLALGGGLIAAAFALLGSTSGALAALVPALLLASGGASINAASNTLVSSTFGPRRGAMLSVMATFGALGSLATPFLFLGSLDPPAVSGRLAALAALGLLVGALPLVVARAAGASAGASLAASLRLARDRPLAGLIALLALDFGIEAVLAGFTGSYAVAVFPGTSGGVLVGLYWSGLCLGRVAAPLALARLPKLVLVLSAGAALGLAVTAMALAPTPAALGLAAAAAGLAVGPMAPTIVSVAGDRYPRQMGAAIGLLLAVAQVGGIVMPWLTGRLTIGFGHRAGLAVPAVAALAIAVGTAVTWRSRALRGVRAAGAEAS